MKPSDMLCQVFAMVDGVCRRSFPFVKFHCGPACLSSKCPGHQEEGDFLAHVVGEPSSRDAMCITSCLDVRKIKSLSCTV